MEDFTSEAFYTALLLTVFAGLSTGIGALLAFFSRKDNYTFLSVGMGFSAGVMVYISFVEILPEATNDFSLLYGDVMGESLALITFFGGFALAALIDWLVPEDVNPHELKSNKQLTILCKSQEQTPINPLLLKRTGVFTAVAIAIHNFPEGFATFVSALDGLALGIPIALAIAIHNIPEGMAVSLPIYHATGDRKKAFYYALGSGLTEPIGALVGFFLLSPLMGELTLGITFGMTAGIMIYISFDELLPAARIYGNAHTTIFGIAFGMGIMAFSLLLFKVIL